jgi:prolyl 4-hydroxylase
MNISNFIEIYKVPTKLCNNLIDYYKKNKEHKVIGEVNSGVNKKIKDSIDVYFYNQSQNKYIKDFFNVLSNCVYKYSIKYDLKETVRTCISNHIQYYKPKGGYPVLHYERSTKNPKRILAYMLYLNTVTDKGGTEFPFQQITLSAIKGNLVIWPAEFTHPHKGIISPTKEKYIATGWFELI